MENIVGVLKFGSSLYGTRTANSDTDFKIIYMPSFMEFIDGSYKGVFKQKFNADGSLAGPNTVMDAGCCEKEYVPIHELFNMAAKGEVQSIEVINGFISGRFEFIDGEFYELCVEFMRRYSSKVPHKNMVGFAKKSTLDYVLRGKRYEKINSVIDFLLAEEQLMDAEMPGMSTKTKKLSLIIQGESTFDRMRRRFDNDSGVTFKMIPLNSVQECEAFEVAGRTFPITTSISHVIASLISTRNGYGHRSISAGDVEWKSMSHAIRVYRQAIELANTGKISFPRPDSVELLAIKNGEVDFEVVKDLLEGLDNEYNQLPASTKSVDISDFIKERVFPYIESTNLADAN